jgi:hypothetical protein
MHEGVDRATFRNKPESTVYPLNDINDEDMRLKHFSWMENKRPKKEKRYFNQDKISKSF